MIKWKEVEQVDILPGTSVTMDDTVVKVKGKLGESEMDFRDNYVTVALKDGKLSISTSKNNKKTNAIVGTWASEIRNMMKGVIEGYEYHMKIDYTHFPTRVSVRGDSVLIENFLGERSPRLAKIVGNTKVSIKGDRVIINGIHKRHVGETAANIERATKIKGFDPRVFQDGVYLLKGEN
jgi:large subunit ribosomal protein L6